MMMQPEKSLFISSIIFLLKLTFVSTCTPVAVQEQELASKAEGGVPGMHKYATVEDSRDVEVEEHKETK